MTQLFARLFFFCLLASLEAAIMRQLGGFGLIPLVLPVLLAVALRVPPREALGLSLLGGLAREPWSGLPLFVATASMVLPTAVVLGARTFRPGFPTILSALLGSLTFVGVLSGLTALTPESSLTFQIHPLLFFLVIPSLAATLSTEALLRLGPLWRPARLPLLLPRSAEPSFHAGPGLGKLRRAIGEP